jgi:hypothetical protein
VITSVGAVKLALKCLAQRLQLLTTELATLDRDLDRLVSAAVPALCSLLRCRQGGRESERTCSHRSVGAVTISAFHLLERLGAQLHC